MNYVIDFGYHKLIVPVNARTAEAISLLFAEKNVYDYSWHDGGVGYKPATRSPAAVIISNEELARAMSRADEAYKD